MAQNPADTRPESVRIADEIRELITTGELKPGDRVPSVRALATQFGVAEMTAQKAKQALESEGLIVTRPGKGSFVLDTPDRPKPGRTAVAGRPKSGQAESDDLSGKLDALAEQVNELATRVSELEQRL